MTLKKKLAAAGLALALGIVGAVTATVPANADPAAPAGCTNARQIGSTAYIKAPNGQTLASVKQYYGVCDGAARNWAYTWVWDAALSNPKWSIKVDYVAIAEFSSSNMATHRGVRSGSMNEQQVISAKTATTRSCTSGVAGLTVYKKGTTTKLFETPFVVTSKVC